MQCVIGMDIHRTFAEVVFWETGRLRPAGRKSCSPFFGQSDKVKIRLTEGGGNEQTEPEAVLCGV